MRNHQEDQDQEITMATMDSQEKSNLETTHNHHHQYHHVQPQPPSLQIFKRSHYQQDNNHVLSKNTNEDERFILKSIINAHEVNIKKPNSLSCSSPTAGEGDTTPPTPKDFEKTRHGQYNIQDSKKTSEDEGFTIKNDYEAMATPQEVVEESGREKLKRHRVEMAGRVWIPDMWGHEDLLKDWIDCTVFDSSLGNNNIMSARTALMQEGRSSLRIQNQC